VTDLVPIVAGAALAGAVWTLFFVVKESDRETKRLEEICRKFTDDKKGLINDWYVGAVLIILDKASKKGGQKIELQDDDKQRLRYAAYVESLLFQFANVLSKARDEISLSWKYGIVCGFATLGASFVFTQDISTNVLALLLFVGLSGAALIWANDLYRCGLSKFKFLRSYEKWMVHIKQFTQAEDLGRNLESAIRALS